MSRNQRSVEEIIGNPREAEVAMGQGESVALAACPSKTIYVITFT